MAVIVQDKESYQKYILLGAGFGAYKATRPSFFGGNLFPNEEEGTLPVVAVSDFNGKIHWKKDQHLKVIEVDGVKIEDLKE